jgi:multiple antibiotic resistance protein
VPRIALDPTLFASAFVTVLVIMDPVGNIPIFLSLTRNHTASERKRAAWHGSAVAAGVIVGFAVAGERVLRVLHISLPALQVAGGLLLLLIALELLRPGGGHGELGQGQADTNIALVPLGTPLLAGPGAIAATMLYARQASGLGGTLSVIGALAAVLVVIWLSMRFSGLLAKVLRDNGIDLLSRVMGLLVAAIAVQLAASGIQEWVTTGVR